jgi:hypothetical protein
MPAKLSIGRLFGSANGLSRITVSSATGFRLIPGLPQSRRQT